MIKWQEVFSKDGLPWQDADRLSASLAVSDLKDLKRLLDAVHIRLCLVKPYQENKNYPLVEARELLPSFDNDMFEYKELPGFAMCSGCARWAGPNLWSLPGAGQKTCKRKCRTMWPTCWPGWRTAMPEPC